MGNICIIGPRSSGKTTYLAGLAYWPDTHNQNFEVTPITREAQNLVNQAEDIILSGDSLKRTEIDGFKIKTVYDLPLYSFQIEKKRRWRKPEEINLVVRDYPGEIFDDLASGISNEIHQEFLNECLIPDIVGCLLLLHKWELGNDRFYRKMIRRFMDLMDRRDRLKNLRLAVAMSKCERGEIWPGRLDPELDLFEVHLPRTRKILRQRIPKNNLQFYAISTFGVLEKNNPRPNRADEEGSLRSVLRSPHQWRPYGLISPLYWLSTGKRMRSGV